MKRFFLEGEYVRLKKIYQISPISKILILSVHIIKSKFMSEVELMLSTYFNETLVTVP